MPGLVAQFPVAPFTTPVNGDDLDAALVVSHDSSIASAHTSHDADPTIHFQSSTLAARPGAGIVGRKWITTDGLRVYFDTGAVWSEIAYLSLAGGGVVAGATTFSAALATAAIVATGTVSGDNFFQANRGGVSKALFGAANAAGQLINDAAQDDAVIRSNGFAIRFSVNSGASSAFRINADGTATFAGAVSMAALTASSGTFSAVITANGGVAIAGGAFAAGTIYKNAVTGLSLAAVAGSGLDFGLFTPGGGNILTVPTGTANVVFAGAVSTGALTVAGGILNTGVPVARFETTGGGPLAGATGIGTEIYKFGIQTYNRTAVAYSAMSIDAADILFNANGGSGRFLFGTTVTTSAAAGDIVLANAKVLRWVNSAASDTLNALQIGSDNVLVVATGLKAVIGAVATVTGAAVGDLSLANNSWLRGANAANTAQKALIGHSAAGKIAIDADAIGTTFGAGAVFAGAVSGITTLAASSSLDVGVGHVKAGTTTAVTAVGATTIYTAVNAQGFAIVHGSSGGRIFCDVITWDTSIPAVVLLVGNIIAGVPGGRTYSMSGSNVQLQMSATGNSVKVVPIELN